MKRIYKKLIAILAVSAITTSTFIGCSSSDAESNVSDGSIQIGIKSDLTSLDPHGQNDVVSGYAVRHMYDTLIDVTFENEFVPKLAESWTISEDGTVYDFKLKENVKFHDGSILTAEDVKFSLERQKNSARVGHLIAMIKDIEVIDNLNFKIIMDTPSNSLISSMAHMGCSVLNKAYVEALEAEGKKLADAPMGTGPYKFESWTPGSSFSLVKNPDYYDSANSAKNDKLEFKIIPEDTSRTIALENGEIDLMMGVPTIDAQRIQDNSDLALDLFDQTRMEYFAINHDKEPFDDVLVREAMNYAINKDDILTVMYDGRGETINSYFTPVTIGYHEVDSPYTYNPEKAKSLLKEAGLEDGFTFNCYVSSAEREKGATVIQANLKEFGITMNIEMMESSTFFDKTGKGDHDACMTGWSANADPDNTFRPLFSSSTVGDGGNRCFYRNEEVDALIDVAATNPDPAAVVDAQTKMFEIFTEDALWVPLVNPDGMVARDADLEGLGMSSMGMERFEGLHFKEIAE
ncbi:hypothetical protein AN396_02405 [Candidatus Epulonipiscium fishelsonii]|uniref:Uncharacterized protein n=1 Tax=Candidatus Epulonipiscium fishelsonii TaxID=77094 RepID=A0ACC8XFA2_9FIRM|nr:hypothetical protein AN396_02405 [Epulopiscium sp. SCG-B11WGA-EpuloA1]